MKAILTMKMSNGANVTSEAEIIEVHVNGKQGYFLAQWPDMKAPVKEEFRLIDSGLSYVIHFTNPADPAQYGSREEATLRRISR